MWIYTRWNFLGNPVTSSCKLDSTTRRFETTIVQCHVRSFCFYPPQAFLAWGESKIRSRRKNRQTWLLCMFLPCYEDSLCWTGKNPGTRFPGLCSPQACRTRCAPEGNMATPHPCLHCIKQSCFPALPYAICWQIWFLICMVFPWKKEAGKQRDSKANNLRLNRPLIWVYRWDLISPRSK